MSGKAIRETVGFGAVVAGLVFVGLEIQQNNKLAQAAAYQAIGIASAAAHDNWAHDRQFTVSTQEVAAMDSTDWRQWRRKATVFARLAETTLLQVEKELLSPDAMELLGFSGWRDIFQPLAPNYAGPRWACVWPLIRPEVSDSFREFVEGGRDTNAIDCSDYDIPLT